VRRANARYFLGLKRNEKEVLTVDGMKAKAIRYYLGESQESFGRRIGVAASTICAIEKNQRDISDYVRSKLVRIESTLPDDFLTFFERFKNSA
jgi:DNA-binding XRE family transcriptional regulator